MPKEKNTSPVYDVLVVGSGVAGLTAAVYAARYNLKVLVVGKDYGLLAEASKVENWPGTKTISGLQLVQDMIEQVKSLGGEVKLDEVTRLLKKNGDFEVVTRSEKTFQAKTLILTLGLEKRALGLPGEKELVGKGISYCAACDAPFTKGKVAAVVGGSDAAASAALLAAEYADKVYIFYRKEALRAEPITVDQVKKNKKIEVVFKSNVKEIIGQNAVEKAKVDIDGEMKDFDIQFLIIEIGQVPRTVILKDLDIKTDKWGYILCDRKQNTNVEGVYAAGDVNSESPMRQAIVAAGEGAVAANSAYIYIKEKEAQKK
jgi:thioredoxin reductase (NADPH)